MQPGSPNETVKLWSGNPNKTVFMTLLLELILKPVSMLLCRSWLGLYLCCTVHRHVYVYFYSRFRWGIIYRLLNISAIKAFFLYLTHCCQFSLSYCTYCSSLGLISFLFCTMYATFKWQLFMLGVTFHSGLFYDVVYTTTADRNLEIVANKWYEVSY